MYERVDRVIDYLNKRFIKLFNEARVIIKDFDELNIISYSKNLYNNIDIITKEALLELAKATVKDLGLDIEITLVWLLERLNEYNPTTKFVYSNELERKRQLFVEGMIASENKNQELDICLRSVSKMVAQYVLEISDSALIYGYKEMGIQLVVWKTEEDKKVCEHCKKLNNKVFKIDNVPPKQHWNCRCYVLPKRI